MAKTHTTFICLQCGAHHTRWMGKCPDCGSWDSLAEQSTPSSKSARGKRADQPDNQPVLLQNVDTNDFERLPVASTEFAQVLGGGLVPGSVVLIGGDPGIGKTTLLTQTAANFANQVGPVLYVSAEESALQVRLRTERLGLQPERLYVFSETCLDQVLDHISQLKPRLVIVDSIQTVYLEDIASAAGSVSQVREGALRLLRQAKELNIPIFLVGHVTKEGTIAGPRVLEHIVDVVLYLEGDRFHQYRLLRGVKNRFGSTNEVGVFEMTQQGMREVSNPSEVFIAERNAGAPGSTVTVTLEGTRPILIEVQALTSYTGNAQPRRTANGFDVNRLLMIIAVLSKRVGLPLFNQDVYVNIVGGLRVGEPAADLAVALAIAASFRNQRIDADLIVLGEIGLSGELRSVSQLERRLGEAARLGFCQAYIPASATERKSQLQTHGLTPIASRSLAEVIQHALQQSSYTPEQEPDQKENESKL
jgi:DNA repair protein RadA/Sms